jgi:hypothetical protein
MHNWNVVYIPTCDGSSFLSQRDEPLLPEHDDAADASGSSSPLYMRGRSILTHTIAHALSMGMSLAKTIVRSPLLHAFVTLCVLISVLGSCSLAAAAGRWARCCTQML